LFFELIVWVNLKPKMGMNYEKTCLVIFWWLGAEVSLYKILALGVGE